MHDAPARGRCNCVAVTPVRVLVVDDHPLFAEALAARLSSEPSVDVLPFAASLAQAEALLASETPDIAVVDLMLGERSGLDVLRAVRDQQATTRVVMLSAVSDVEPVTDAVRLGARAWVPKSVDTRLLVSVIATVAAGGAWLPPGLLAGVLDNLTRDPDRDPDGLITLTAREREVLQCMVDGLSRAEIAPRLFLSTNTVRTHTQNLLAKLDCHSALEAVALARRNGMRPSGESPGASRSRR